MDVVERIKLRMQQLKLSQAEISRRMGKSNNATLWSFLSGRTKTFREMNELAKVLGTNIEWLTTGNGPVEASIKDRPHADPDPKFMRILALCMREGRKPAYKHLDEKTVIEIASSIYEQTKTSGGKKLVLAQVNTLMSYQAKRTKH